VCVVDRVRMVGVVPRGKSGTTWRLPKLRSAYVRCNRKQRTACVAIASRRTHNGRPFPTDASCASNAAENTAD